MITEKLDDKYDVRFDPPTSPNAQASTPWRLSAPKHKYLDSNPLTLYNSLRKGKTLTQIARDLSCSRQTLLNWINDIPEMKEAHELGSTAFEAYYDDLVQSSMQADSASGKILPETNTKLLETYLKKQTISYKDKEDNNQNNTNTLTQTTELVSQLNKFADTLLNSTNPKEPKDITPPKNIE